MRVGVLPWQMDDFTPRELDGLLDALDDTDLP